MPNGVINDPHVFVAIEPDGTVTIVAHRAEMGTGSRTSHPDGHCRRDGGRLGAREDRPGRGDETKYGNQDTDGSRSLRHHIQPAREIGASVRRMLEEAGRQAMGRPSRRIVAARHEVMHKTLGTRLGYGDLALTAMALPTPEREALKFKDEKEFRYIGKGKVQIYDLHDITTGKAVYGADVSVSGMNMPPWRVRRSSAER